MATKVVMEALSPTMEEGRLVEWKKGEGDPVAVGDVLAEVETDKAVMELVARAGGTLLKQVVPAGTTVPVSELVALIGEPGEPVENGKPAPAAAPKPPAPAQQAPQTAPDRNQPTSLPPAPPATAATEGAPLAPPRAGPASPSAAPSAGRVKASPLARRIATERGIDLSAVAGSGPEGRIVLRDLEAAPSAAPSTAPARGAAPAAAAPAASPVPRVVVPQADGAPFSDVPLTQLRKTIA